MTAYLEVDSRKGFVRIDKEESSVFKSDYRLKITNENNSEKVYIIEGSIKSLVCKDNRIALNLGKEVQFIDNNG